MRDNGSNASSGNGGSHIRPVSWIRTDHQLSHADGFKPEEIARREPFNLTTDGSYTMRLAEPPKWTHRNDLPCVSLVPVAHSRDPFDTSDPIKAEALCAGCPVRSACLDAALAEEDGLSYRSRYLVRGGLTPIGRAEWSEQAIDNAQLGEVEPADVNSLSIFG